MKVSRQESWTKRLKFDVVMYAKKYHKLWRKNCVIMHRKSHFRLEKYRCAGNSTYFYEQDVDGHSEIKFKWKHAKVPKKLKTDLLRLRMHSSFLLIKKYCRRRYTQRLVSSIQKGHNGWYVDTYIVLKV